MNITKITFPITIRAYPEKFELKEPFVISRYSFTHSQMMVVELSSNGYIGRGECEPHEYDEKILLDAVEYAKSFAEVFEKGMSIELLNQIMPSGPIRNAFDCALWDLIAKIHSKPVWQLLGMDKPKELPTVYTLSIYEPDIMAKKASDLKDWSRFKIKLGGKDLKSDIARVNAIRKARPDAELIVDANGGWDFETLKIMASELADFGVLLIEQPLLEGKDELLLGFESPVPLCADESCLDRNSLPYIIGRYQFINIKLDKTGGLTEAMALAKAANDAKLGIMVGCMAATSLAMAPAFLIAQNARFIDLDGPMLIKQDRPNGMKYENGLVYAPNSELWG